MATLQEIQAMWEKDSEIDELNLTTESLRIPKLHAKYLNMLTSYRLNKRKIESDLLRILRNKYRYYRGEMSREELIENGWDQYLGPKLLKSDINSTIESDDDIIKLNDRLEYINTIIYQLESILKSINTRSFDIKNAIDYMRWTNGST